MNRVFISGNLVSKPEEKEGKNGKFLTFKVADNINKNDCIFWDCLQFSPYNTKILQYLDKGSSVIVTAEVQQPKTYNKKDGSTGVSSSVIVKDIAFGPSKHKDDEKQEPATTAVVAENNEQMPF